MYKVDLHTHSILSHDGGIKKKQYVELLNNGMLDCIAITDHNETRFARILHEELGDKIIIGEEIQSKDGEIIGLFLTKTIPGGLSAVETVAAIKRDSGLVYIPHPFEKGRHGLQIETLKLIAQDIDIFEVFNGRGFFRGKSNDAYDFANKSKLVRVASSDAHCMSGIGYTYSSVAQMPNKNSLVKLLKKDVLQNGYGPWYSYLCPGINKIKNKIILGI